MRAHADAQDRRLLEVGGLKDGDLENSREEEEDQKQKQKQKQEKENEL